jgi:hypothetical protein
MSTLLLKKIEAEVQRTFFRIFIPSKTLLGKTIGSIFSDKIVPALTNGRTIDKNSETTCGGDEREEL